MAWDSLISAVSAIITDNGNNEITGALLRDLINNNVIPQLGANLYKGVALPGTVPDPAPESEIFYIAKDNGTYSNFAGLNIADQIAIFKYVEGTGWIKDVIFNYSAIKGTYAGTLEDLKAEIDAAVFNGLITYQTVADLPTSPYPAEGTPAKVANDPTPANNGYYSVSGGAWVQDSNALMLINDLLPKLGADLDLNTFKITGNGAISTTNVVASLIKAFEVYNSAQQGLGGEPTAVVIHHYTDGHLAQLDNVGTGDILRLVNAQNAVRRADQASDFIGTGAFLKLITTQPIAGGSQETIMFIDKDGHFQFPRATDYFQIALNKTPDSNYAFQFMCNNDQVNLINFDNRFLIQQESASNNAFISDRGIRFYTNGGTNSMDILNLRVDFKVPFYLVSGEARILTGASLSIRDGAVLKIGDGNDWQMNHNGTDNNIDLYNGDLVIRQNTTEKIRFERTTGKINAVDCNFSGLPTYADDSAAGTGGLTAGDLYKTATGELRIKL